MIVLTRPQRQALFQVFRRDWPNYITPFLRHEGTYCTHCGCWSQPGLVRVPSINYRRFRAQVQPYMDKSGCVMVPWKGMWLGIEPDGYTHS